MPKPRSRRRPRKSKSRARTAAEETDWWLIKSILDERAVDGHVEYLVDWEDNSRTGESYPPNWEREVTEDAKEEWEATKARRAQEPAPPTPAARPGNTSQGDSQESQAPRPANWRNIQRANARGLTRPRSEDDPEEDDRPRKRIRHDYRETPSEGPVPSTVTSASSPDSTTEYPYQSPPPAGEVAVELCRASDFDPTGYHSVTNTQTTCESSQSLAELEEADRRVVFDPGFSPKTILDSQESPGHTLLSHHSTAPVLVSTPAQPSDSRGEALVIPDSQDHLQRLPSAPATVTSGQDSVIPPTPNDSTRSTRDALTDSHRIGSDIPSRQPDSNARAQGSSSAGLNSDTARRSVQRLSDPEPRPCANSQQGSSIAFLSQPALPLITDTLGSSSYSETLRQPGIAIDSAGQSLIAGGQAAAIARESQAAQVVIRDFGSASSGSHVSQSSSSHAHSISVPESQWAKQVVGTSALGAVRPGSGSLRESQSQLAPSRPADQTMERRNEEARSSSAGHRSVAESLRQMVDDTFGDLETGDSQTLPAEVPAGQNEAGPDTQRGDSTNPGIQSQPAGQEDPWATGVTISQRLSDRSTSTPRRSAVEEMRDLVEQAWGPEDLDAGSSIAEPQGLLQQATVAPAEITWQVGHKETDSLMPPLSSLDDLNPAMTTGTGVVALTQPPMQLDSEESPRVQDEGATPTEHVVTLPFQASMRPLYQDTLLDHKADIIEFGAVFSSELFTPPDEQLVEKIDRLFGRLHNICDYPQDAVGTALEKLSPVERTKYACDANPKFTFVYELLDGLENENEILIVARSVDLLRLLYDVTEALGIDCVCNALGKPGGSRASSAIRVTLALPDDETDAGSFTVVVAFDHAFNGSPVAQKLSATSPGKPPLVLVLITTHSIEHIDLHVPAELNPLERKNALLSGIVRARTLVTDPDRGYLEPDKLATVFTDYLNGQVETIDWEPVPMPDEVLDIYLATQGEAPPPDGTGLEKEQENNRKRKFDDSDDEDAKRMRTLPLEKSTVQSNEPPLPDAVRDLLDTVSPAKPSRKASARVPVAALESLAEKMAEYKRKAAAADIEDVYKSVVDRLEQRVKEYERTNEKIYRSYRSALEDRTKFESETRQAEARLEAAQTSNEKAQSRILELEATIARMKGGTDDATPQENLPASPEAQLKEAQDKVQTLEKRLENARQEADYARTMYQDASAAASSVGAENLELKERNQELQKKASDNMARIHQIQAESSASQHVRHIAELRTQVRERELELDRAREELRQLRNGRRETRQASVPRSPRMGMMSPRTRAYGGGSASRGTSPAPVMGIDPATAAAAAAIPGMQFMPQPTGNGRWNHLRE